VGAAAGEVLTRPTEPKRAHGLRAALERLPPFIVVAFDLDTGETRARKMWLEHPADRSQGASRSSRAGAVDRSAAGS